MKATETRLLAFLKKSPQFKIPIYQRTYSWEQKECRQLWDDIIRAGQDIKSEAHFIGSIVYIEESLSQVSHQAPLLVIDGQQRITTLTLILAALASSLVDEEEPFEGFTQRKIRNYYLLNPEESGERHYKLILTKTDNTTLQSIVKDDTNLGEASVRVSSNYQFFKKWISEHPSNLSNICAGIAKLMVVDIALDRDHDNPQLIFESMNSTGRELSQADLIRNYVLMGLRPIAQTRMYEHFWSPMEQAFGQRAYSIEFDKFMRTYLTVKTGEIPRKGDVYEAFKTHSAATVNDEAETENLLKDMLEHARYYCCIALGAESNTALSKVFRDLRDLKVDTALPLLLELYYDYNNQILTHDEFVKISRLIEAYVFRRAASQIPTNSLNKTFANFSKFIKKDRYLESVEAHLLMLPTYRRFPRDAEFVREIQVRDLYNNPRRSYWLRRLENFQRKERVPVDEYTIEHIMPQNEKLSSQWKNALGEDWERIHEKWLHTLGNLTLTGYNSEYYDHPFVKKRDMEGGFKDSPLRVNQGLGKIESWNEDEIQKRARRLAAWMKDVWPEPKLASQILVKYQAEKDVQTGYSYDDHIHFNSSKNKSLYASFRKEVFALDPGIVEEVYKVYIAFKAETNFVDVVPQAKGLRLSLNMPFTDIIDPNNLCKDVTHLGRHGNGDVEILLNDEKNLPYVLGLVRQSLDRQLGNDIES